MSALRRLKAYVLGHNTDMDATAAELQEAAIPVSTEECRGCADPCDQGAVRPGDYSVSCECADRSDPQDTTSTRRDSMWTWKHRCWVL